MFSANNKISLRQLQILLILDIFGASVITLPRTAAQYGGQNGWLVVLGGSLIVVLQVYLLSILAERYADKTFVEFSNELLSKPIGIILSIGFGIKILIGTGLQLRICSEIIRQTMLFTTPLYALSLSMILVAVYLDLKGYEIRARTAEILIVIMIVPIFVVYILTGLNTDLTNLLPVFQINERDFFRGAWATAVSFQGVEFLLLVFPFINKPKKSVKASMQAVIFLGFLMIATTVLTTARFGSNDIKVKLWPVLQMMDTVDFPGAFIERQDVLIITFWVVSAFACINAGVFLNAFVFSKVFKREKSYRKYIWAGALIIFIISLVPKDIVETYEWLNIYNKTLGTAYLFVIPIVLLVISHFKKIGGDKN